MYQPKDYTQQIAEYIRKNLAKGYTLDSLRFSLKTQGYSRISVENAIDIVNRQLAEKAPLLREKPQIIYKTDPREEEKKGFWQRLFGW